MTLKPRLTPRTRSSPISRSNPWFTTHGCRQQHANVDVAEFATRCFDPNPEPRSAGQGIHRKYAGATDCRLEVFAVQHQSPDFRATTDSSAGANAAAPGALYR